MTILETAVLIICAAIFVAVLNAIGLDEIVVERLNRFAERLGKSTRRGDKGVWIQDGDSWQFIVPDEYHVIDPETVASISISTDGSIKRVKQQKDLPGEHLIPDDSGFWDE